jgi:PAS domain-containing protein
MNHRVDDQLQPSSSLYAAAEIRAGLQALCIASGARLAALLSDCADEDVIVDALGQDGDLFNDFRVALLRDCVTSMSTVLVACQTSSVECHAAIRLPGEESREGLLLLAGVCGDFCQSSNAGVFTGYAALISALLRQRRSLRAHARMIAEQGKALAHHRKIFERSSEVAKIGVWECDLDNETLAWTDGVYDMFELPRGSAITRPETLQYY